MKAAVKAETINKVMVRFAVMAGLTLCLIGVMGLHAHSEDATDAVETGSVDRDVMVAPVRRVFPKTPTDRELNRLSKTAKAKKRDSKKKSTKR